MTTKGILLAALLCLTAFFPALAQDATTRLTDEAKAARERVLQNTLQANEIDMIEFRRTLMGQPGLQLYVVFFNDMGQPIEYFVTQGKCTSSNKRLLPSWKFVTGQTGVDGDGNGVYGDYVMDAPALDGTYGSSDDYIYCKTADGKNKQWNGRYYISDAPIELTIKPLIIDGSGGIQGQS